MAVKKLLLLGLLAVLVGAQGDDTLCSTCKWVARVVEDGLCDVDAGDYLVKVIQQQICPAVAGKDPSQCQQLAETFVPVAIQWLRYNTSPEQLCSGAGVCGPQKALVTQALPARRASRAAVRDGIACGMCEYVVTEVKTELSDPVTLQAWKDKALKACAALPTELANTCTDLVENYAELLVSMVEGLDAQASCTAVGLCAPQLLARLHVAPLPAGLIAAVRGSRLQQLPQLGAAAQQQQLGSNSCDMCRLAVIEVHTLVSNPAVQAQITNYTKGLCDSMGQGVADTCRQYVDLYGPVVFTVLQQYLQPDALCQGMGMCDKTAAAFRGSAGAAAEEVDIRSVLILGRAGAAGASARSKVEGGKKMLPGVTLDEAAYARFKQALRQEAAVEEAARKPQLQAM